MVSYRRSRSSAGSCGDGDRVQVDDAVDPLAAVLPLDVLADRPDVVAQVLATRRLDAAEDSCVTRHGCPILIDAASQGAGWSAELVRRGEEVPIGEADREEGRERDAAEQRPEQDQLEANGIGGAGAREQHADHRAREEDQAGRLGGVDQGDHPRPQAATDDRRGSLCGGRAESQRRLELPGGRSPRRRAG